MSYRMSDSAPLYAMIIVAGAVVAFWVVVWLVLS